MPYQPYRATTKLCLLAILTILSQAAIANSQVRFSQEGEGRKTIYVYRICVDGAKPQSPIFENRLTVPPDQTVPGNWTTHYLRSFSENIFDRPMEKAREKYGEAFEQWYDVSFPIEDLPLEEVEAACKLFDDHVHVFLKQATLCRDIDWGLSEEDLRGLDTVEFRLPGIQKTRVVSRVLALRTRLAVAQGDFQTAIEHMRMNYRLAEAVSKMKFLVSGLVAISENGITNESMIDFIAAPNSPNMYWPMCELPDPIVDIRDAIRLETSIGIRLVPELESPENSEHSGDEWAKIFQDFVRSMSAVMELQSVEPNSRDSVGSDYLSLGLAAVTYPAAKERLVQSGMDRKTVEAMNVGHVLMVDASRDYRTLVDASEGLNYVKGPKRAKMVKEFNDRLENAARQFRPGAVLTDVLLPATDLVKTASLKIRRENAALIVIEAMRNHLAEHGELPQKLDDMSLPAPNNPATGKPFHYENRDGTGILTLPGSDGCRLHYRFEISARKS